MVDDTSPKYYRLYELFYNKILSGEWKNGQKLLPERELCEKFEVSRITLRETLRRLADQNLIIRKRGHGTFVKSQPAEQKLTKLYTLREHFNKSGVENSARIREYQTFQADERFAEIFKIKVGDPVIMIKRIFYANTKPYVLETTYLPADRFPGITKRMVDEGGLYHTFAVIGVEISKAIEQLQPILVRRNVAKLLQEEDGSIGMRIERTTYSGNIVVEYTKSIVPGEFFIYTVELGR